MATDPAQPKHRCRVCDCIRRRDFALCFCCTTIVEQLRLPLVPVVAMTDYRVGDRMHRLLRGYKDAPSAEARAARTTALAALIELWLAANGALVRARFAGGWDLVTTVPSSGGRLGSPADALLEQVPALAERARSLLVRGDGPLGHLVASRGGYVLSPGADRRTLRARSVLVFDDSVTTGARAQSAVAALRDSGARVKGILVVGRALGAGSRYRTPLGDAAETRLG